MTGSGARPVRAASVAALGGLLLGYDVSLVNSAVGALQSEFAVGNAVIGFAVGAVVLGAAAGSMITGRLAGRAGRLPLMQLAAALFVVYCAGAAFANSIWLVSIFRVVGGFGIGVAAVACSAYIAEISPPRMRGRLASLQQLGTVLGIMVALLVNWALADIAGGPRQQLWLGLEAWRWMFLVAAVPALGYGLLVFTIPESPRYLVAAHQIPQARRVLTLLFGPRDVETTLDQIARTLTAEAPPSWRDLRKPGGGLYPVVWLGLGVAAFQQLVGISPVFLYSKVLWQAVGFGENSSFAIAVITAVINVTMTVTAVALVDKVGRRPLLLTGSAGMAAALAAMSVVFASSPVIDGKPQLGSIGGLVVLIALNGFVVACALSWGPLMWVLLGEIFPNRIRAAALGLAAAAQWLTNWAVTVTFPAMRNVLGLAFGGYAVFAVLSFIFVWKWIRETKGVSLEDMHADSLGELGS